MINQLDAIDDFNAAIQQQGYVTTYKVQGTGKIERFKLGDENGKSGWAVLFLDKVPAGSFGNWKTGEKHTWCSVDREQVSTEERAVINKLLQQAEAARNKEQARIQRMAAKKVMKLLSEAAVPKDHQYLTAKKVGPYTSRIHNGNLLIPVQDRQGITSAQIIAPDGSKKFFPNGRVKGCYHLIGHPEGITYITEGWATGATIHKLTGRPVVVAFNAGNLSPVALSVRASYPDARFLIAADNDSWGVKNVGVAAAKGTELPYIIPEFKPCDTKPTDFNDLYLLEGEDEAIRQLTPPKNMPETQPVVTQELPDQWVALPDTRGEKQTPIATISNLTEVLRRLSVTIRYNVISKEEETLIPDEAFTQDNKANASLAWIESMCAKYGMPTEKIGQFLTYIADNNPYNPVATWIESKPWDGVSRIGELASTITITSEDEDEWRRTYKETIIKRWLISAVAAAYEPTGISSQGILVLQGGQAMGKTSWFKRLCPSYLQADGITLDLRDKDSQLNALAYWLVELGELDATFRRSDIAQLKSFITRDKDVIRVAYAKRKSEYPRRTVFFASVNEQEFLHDATGNRRFWTLQCEGIKYDHKVDMQQLWAEVLSMYKAGEPWSLLPDELKMLNIVNEAFEVVDEIEDQLKTIYAWDTPEGSWRRLTATQIGNELGYAQNVPAKKIARFVKKLNGNKGYRTRDRRLLLVPERR